MPWQFLTRVQYGFTSCKMPSLSGSVQRKMAVAFARHEQPALGVEAHVDEGEARVGLGDLDRLDDAEPGRHGETLLRRLAGRAAAVDRIAPRSDLADGTHGASRRPLGIVEIDRRPALGRRLARLPRAIADDVEAFLLTVEGAAEAHHEPGGAAVVSAFHGNHILPRVKVLLHIEGRERHPVVTRADFLAVDEEGEAVVGGDHDASVGDALGQFEILAEVAWLAGGAGEGIALVEPDPLHRCRGRGDAFGSQRPPGHNRQEGEGQPAKSRTGCHDAFSG